MVVIVDGKQVKLDGRAAAMVRWLATQAGRLNGRLPLRLEFHCSGNTIKPKIYRDEKPLQV